MGYAEQASGDGVAFIREQLPQSSVFAYTPQELLAFNRERRSPFLFDPYGAFGD